MSAKRSKAEEVQTEETQITTEQSGVSQSKLQAIRHGLASIFKERREVVDMLMTAIIARQNAFLLGPPGTAKSAMVNTISGAIGGRYFYALLGKTTAPEELFGQVSIEALKQSRYERNTKGMAPDAHLVCFDEVFKCSTAVLNTNLTLMNERTFVNGGTVIKTPIISVIGASNEVPDSTEAAAVYDRFTLKRMVNYIQSDDEMGRILMAGGVESASIPSISMEELEAEQQVASQVKISEELVQKVLELRRLIKSEGLEVSDRKWIQAMKTLRAYAHLNGHAEVQEEDLEILENVLWDKPEQYKTVKRLVSKVSNPVGEQVMRITDAIQEVFDNLKKGTIQAAEAAQKIKTTIKQLEKLDDKKGNPRVQEALASARKTQQRILREFLGFE